MTVIDIRKANPADAGIIADLSRKTFYETFAAVNTKSNMEKFMNQQFTRDSLMQEVGLPGNYFFLAYDGENPVGYCRLKESETPFLPGQANTLEISRIYVINKAIGSGVGKQLMNACIKLASEMQKEIIWLGVWEKNLRAINFYIRQGFEKFAEHPFILGDDVQTDWLMKKTIS
jgi:diamine N-acetyltransferase